MKNICFKYFSTITLKTQSKITKVDLIKADLNWALAKYNITTKGDIRLNEVKPSSSTDEVVPKNTIENMNEDRLKLYQRKLGKLISSSDNVYVNSISIEGKKVVLISSEQDSIASLSNNSSFNGSYENESIKVLVLTKGELNVEKFGIIDKKQKLIMTNSVNASYLKDLVNKI